MISSNRGRYPAPWLRRRARLLTHPCHGCPPPARAAAPAGFTVAGLTVKAGAMTGQQHYAAAKPDSPR